MSEEGMREVFKMADEFEKDLTAFYGADSDERWEKENHDSIRREAVRLAKQHVRAEAHYEMALDEREVREKIARVKPIS